ncbi:Peptidoglycan-binding lysin domain-containing protein [Cynara cardunculus var. scolymus]|uniref:Peptidoglycan-binding lysin domain-containing protein n=1 Tax=Cynara cardunculus var. scolymus TaxID=59895 RepID=A0A118JZP2_CYNCS|nr:Peptidoglycan-binding lysin domain-containing protein [Cynara cardunculus var. scolymus]
MNSINSIYGQESYDSTSCIEHGFAPGTSYTCTNTTLTNISCQTFLIFRSNHQFPTISAISALFGSPPTTLLHLNNINYASDLLSADREVLIPVTCSCSGDVFRTRINYTITEKTTLSDTACGVFEGLVRTITLLEENPNLEDVIKVGFVLNVPLKCACPNKPYKYLVTYPLVSGDSVIKVSTKFDISMNDVLQVNGLTPDTTIYPNSTILIPLYSEPMINLSVPNLQPPTPGFYPTKPIERKVKTAKLKKVYIVVSIIGFGLVLAILIVTGLYVNALNKCKRDIFVIPSMQRSSFTSFSTPRVSSPRSRQSPITRSSPSSCLSPDLLAGIKYSLYNFTIDEIKKVARDFNEDCKVSENAYRGLFDDVQVLVKEIEFSEIRHVIDLYSKINHVNVVKLIGVCYNESSWSYLVLEHPGNGSLRDCLTNSSSLTWHRRTQIAFDVAMGLHYLHYCIVPPYMQTGLGSGNIFVTSKWRAKLTVLSRNTNLVLQIGSSNSEYENFDVLKASEKENILEFGMVLLEILSGKVKTDEKSIGFLGGEGNERGCFDHLRSFIDPNLKDDYPLAEALCLGVLAKACVECDPFHRPSMEDVLKVLARMV